jgi:hypothetical protein
MSLGATQPWTVSVAIHAEVRAARHLDGAEEFSRARGRVVDTRGGNP